MPKLVWVSGPKGPEPQLLVDDSVFGVEGDKFPRDIVKTFTITSEEAKLSLDALVKKYPVEGA